MWKRGWEEEEGRTECRKERVGREEGGTEKKGNAMKEGIRERYISGERMEGDGTERW